MSHHFSDVFKDVKFSFREDNDAGGHYGGAEDDVNGRAGEAERRVAEV